jgi:hypothetical protein
VFELDKRSHICLRCVARKIVHKYAFDKHFKNVYYTSNCIELFPNAAALEKQTWLPSSDKYFQNLPFLQLLQNLHHEIYILHCKSIMRIIYDKFNVWIKTQLCYSLWGWKSDFSLVQLQRMNPDNPARVLSMNLRRLDFQLTHCWDQFKVEVIVLYIRMTIISWLGQRGRVETVRQSWTMIRKSSLKILKRSFLTCFQSAEFVGTIRNTNDKIWMLLLLTSAHRSTALGPR